MLRSHVISAVFKRNVLSYFSGVLGYLFIVVFVVAAAFLAFSPQFFASNLASLDQLSQNFPLLLLFLVPAITMTAWADEKRLGTDELLFTLPATDGEILLGKYLAVLAVYTVALAFSFTHLIMLDWIGEPDWGVMFSTCLGYWLAGAMLLSAGMFASVLTSSNTVAFVLGAAICAIPVFIGELAGDTLAGQFGLSGVFRAMSLPEQMRDFSYGMVPLSGLVYFVSTTLFFLYLNLVFIMKRHWSSRSDESMNLQFLVRGISLAVVLMGLNIIANQVALARADLTEENLYSISPTTRELISGIGEDNPITIQAFLSSEVPADYVPVRKQLVGLLRRFDQMAGGAITVRFVDVEPYSKEAEEAEYFGIEPESVMTERDGRRMQENLFLGLVITSRRDEVVIPFFGAGTPVEYELTRSIHTVSKQDRLVVGVLETDANVISENRSWEIVNELRKQYEVEQVSADTPIDSDKYDVLLAVMPSSLNESQMQNLVSYVEQGNPTLIFDDPFPWFTNSGFGVSGAPRQSKPRPGGMFGGMQNQPPEPKADGGKATSLLRLIDVEWPYDQIVWDEFNPHPEYYAVVPPEYVFVTPKSGVSTAINPDSTITSGLQEILCVFAGTVRPRRDSELKFEPLLRTGVESGLFDWSQFTSESFDFQSMSPAAGINPNRIHAVTLDSDAHVIGAHITSESEERPRNVVFVADADMISDFFFVERQRAQTNLTFDNVAFVLNAVDVLAGDTSYVELRNRRPKLRTLTAVESEARKHIDRRTKEEQAAEEEAEQQLERARQRFEDLRKQLEDSDLSAREKELQLSQLAAAEERKLAVAGENIKREKDKRVDEIRDDTQRSIREIEERFGWWAVLIPPIPAILLGILVLSNRLASERRDIAPDRRLRKK